MRANTIHDACTSRWTPFIQMTYDEKSVGIRQTSSLAGCAWNAPVPTPCRQEPLSAVDVSSQAPPDPRPGPRPSPLTSARSSSALRAPPLTASKPVRSSSTCTQPGGDPRATGCDEDRGT